MEKIISDDFLYNNTLNKYRINSYIHLLLLQRYASMCIGYALHKKKKNLKD